MPTARSSSRMSTIARDNGSFVELSSGAQPGDRLVLNISSQIAPGQVVAANEAGRCRRGCHSRPSAEVALDEIACRLTVAAADAARPRGLRGRPKLPHAEIRICRRTSHRSLPRRTPASAAGGGAETSDLATWWRSLDDAEARLAGRSRGQVQSGPGDCARPAAAGAHL